MARHFVHRRYGGRCPRGHRPSGRCRRRGRRRAGPPSVRTLVGPGAGGPEVPVRATPAPVDRGQPAGTTLPPGRCWSCRTPRNSTRRQGALRRRCPGTGDGHRHGVVAAVGGGGVAVADGRDLRRRHQPFGYEEAGRQFEIVPGCPHGDSDGNGDLTGPGRPQFQRLLGGHVIGQLEPTIGPHLEGPDASDGGGPDVSLTAVEAARSAGVSASARAAASPAATPIRLRTPFAGGWPPGGRAWPGYPGPNLVRRRTRSAAE